MIGCSLAQYRVIEKIGEGGMGVVYRALDERLGRCVALKVIRGDADENHRRRLWREARVAAQVSHANLCQLYDITEADGTLFLVMELLKGRPLSDRLRSGPCTLQEAVPIMRQMLTGLMALHRSGAVHRDLKPSNVYLTADGVKLLDFGLAQTPSFNPSVAGATLTLVTESNQLVGTPHYMSPEQINQRPLTPASDLFAAGSVFFEMLTGSRAFDGDSFVEVFYAILHRNPPAITGSRALDRVDGVIRKAIEKPISDRFGTAADMLEALANIDADASTASIRRTEQRLIVLPFRMLRPDPDIEFLAFSLPDAITSSLSSLGSLIIRSTMAGRRIDTAALDPGAIGKQAGVDAFVTGTLLQAGGKIRVSAQLIEAESGNVLWSHVADTLMRDVFELQDEIVRNIVGSLMIPLTARESRLLSYDVPANSTAYECYLRAVERNPYSSIEAAVSVRDLLLRCVTLDPDYAPGWARLGRAYHILGKFHEEPDPNIRLADESFQRAFELNPDLALAHHFYTSVQTDRGHSAEALERLIGRLRTNRHDAFLLAGLVHACRYEGLLDESLAAHRRCVALDPNMVTSVGWTYRARLEFENALGCHRDDRFPVAFLLADLGRNEESLRLLTEQNLIRPRGRLMNLHADLQRTILEKDWSSAQAFAREAAAMPITDPEARFNCARYTVQADLPELSLQELNCVLDGGYNCAFQMQNDPVFEPVRRLPGFGSTLRRALDVRWGAQRRFVQLGGPIALGMTTPS